MPETRYWSRFPGSAPPSSPLRDAAWVTGRLGGSDVLGCRCTFVLRTGGGSSKHSWPFRQSSSAGLPDAFTLPENSVRGYRADLSGRDIVCPRRLGRDR